jgi:predicted ATPase/DNA-binding SARP family transcriptional activator
VASEGLRVGVLGTLEVLRGGVPVGPAGNRRRALFAMLALRANDVVPVADLVDGLWGTAPPASAVGVIQTYVSTWRKALGDGRLESVGGGYRLRLETAESDLLAFLDRAETGRRSPPSSGERSGRTALEQALAMWRGPPLPELSGEPFHAVAVRPIRERRTQTIEAWAAASLASGSGVDLTGVVAALEEARREEPWRERLTELLMWAMVRQGRQHAALELYSATQQALADELGADPGAGLQEMHGRVLRQDAALLGPAPEPAAARARVDRLDSFVGREHEVADVLDLLAAHRLVVLTGAGGAGKTRLAEVVGSQWATRTGQPSTVVELASVDDSALVPATIAARLGRASAEPVQALVAMLARRPLLLVLDNVDHLPATGTLVTTLLRGTTGLRILVTTRQPLRIQGEQQYVVPPLPVPPSEVRDALGTAASAGVRLLVDRARTADPHFELSDANAGVVGDIVRRLDGLPLALEIVAPWLRALTPDGVLEQLERPLDLPGRTGDGDRRHRTLRDAIEWSYRHLDGDSRRLLSRMSVLRGGASLPALEAICGEGLRAPVMRVVVELVDRSLVQPAPAVGALPRFRLLETIRRFSAEHLAADPGDAEATQRRAADWFAAWAVGLAAHSEGPETASWLAQAGADADNLRTAIDVLDRAGRTTEHLQLVVDAMVLWFEAGHEREGERRLERALDLAPPEAPARAIGLAYLAWLHGTHDRRRAADRAAEAVVLARAAGDRPVLGFALQTLGDTLDDFAGAAAACEAAAGVAADLGPERVRYGPTAGDAVACGAAHTLAGLWAHRSLATALAHQERALTLAELEGDRRITAVNAARLGLLHLHGGNVAAARRPIARAGDLMTEAFSARWEDIVRFAQASLAQHEGRTDEAERRLSALVDTALPGGRLLHIQLGSCALTDLLVDSGRIADADAVLRRAETVVAAGSDARSRARLEVRRARLLRLDGRRTPAVALLADAAAAFDEDELTPERIVWFVERSATASADDARAHVRRLDAELRRTGIALPPWERRMIGRPAPEPPATAPGPG